MFQPFAKTKEYFDVNNLPFLFLSLDISRKLFRIASLKSAKGRIMSLNQITRSFDSARAISFGTLTLLLFNGVHLALAAQSPQAPMKLTVTTKSLPNATVGVEYYAVIAAAGGEPPYDCSGTGLPPNIAFHYTSDTLGGKATTPGTYPVVIAVKDSADPPHTASATFQLTVVAAK